MKKFIQKIALFLILVLISACVLDFFLSYKLKQDHNSPAEFEVWNDIYSKKLNCKIAIYGSSRAWVQFDPKLIENKTKKSCYNFGMDGQNFEMQYLRHLEYFKNNQPPETIILSLDWFSLEKNKNIYEKNQFLPYQLFNENYITFLRDKSGFCTLDFYVPLLRYYGKRSTLNFNLKNSFTKNRKKPHRVHGFHSNNYTWKKELLEEKVAENQFSVKIDHQVKSLLIRFLKDCQKRQIKVILVYPPEFIKGQKVVTNRREIMQTYKSTAEKFKLQFIDFSKEDICTKVDLFYNVTHLNSKGAQIFTEELLKKIDK